MRARSLWGWIVVAAVPTTTSGQCVEAGRDVSAWWPLDEVAGSTAEDIVGGRTGAHVNGPAPAAGLVGGALAFDGSNDYVGVPDDPLWAFGDDDFTIELWANFSAPGGGTIGHPGDIFIGSDDGAGNQRKWFFALGGGFLNFHVNGPGIGAKFFPLAPFSPVVGQWYHLAVSRKGSLYSIYADGVLLETAINEDSVPDASAALTIGQAESLGYMNGRLDEVTIHRRALTAGELQAIHAAGSAGKCKQLGIATPALPAAQLGAPYAFQLEAAFGTSPLTWMATGGVPPGLTLGIDGLLDGTPTEPGAFAFEVMVMDGDGDVAVETLALDVLFVLPPPDIVVHKSGTVPVPGRVLDYFIVVENVGDVTAAGVEVLEVLFPVSYFTYLSAEPPPQSTTEIALLWTVASLDPGESELITYSVELSPTVPIGVPVPGAVWAGASGGAEGASQDWAEHVQDVPCKLNSVECQTLLAQCALPGCHPLSPISLCSACPSIWETCTQGCDSCTLHPSTWTVECEDTQGAIDPNEKVVAGGRYIQPDQLLTFAIHYENVGTIEAKDVFVEDVLDARLDLSTLEILSTEGVELDASTRTLRWELLDTDLLPGATDEVLFQIRPVPGLASGTDIPNEASIQFEVFDVFVTNQTVNTIDTDAPTGTVEPLPAQSPSPDIPLSWTGVDPVGEIDTYDVFSSVDGGPYEAFLEGTRETSALFLGEAGRTYRFLCIATDTAGNVEVQGPLPEAETTVVPDADGDGVPDDQDACPHSGFEPTIVLGGCDSGVRNRLFADGCTMADAIRACGATGPGRLLRCLQRLTAEWKALGWISEKQAVQLLRCVGGTGVEPERP